MGTLYVLMLETYLFIYLFLRLEWPIQKVHCKKDDSMLAVAQWGFVVKVDASENENAFQE